MTDKREASDKRDLYSQMDKAAVRTAADIEQKYNIGKSFAEVAGIAEDARTNAATAQKTAESVDSKLDQEEIFRRLTNNGSIQGMRQMGDKYYFSGECIEALDKLFANDIDMSGKFTHTAEIYLPPTDEVIKNIEAAYMAGTYVEWYDFDGDGRITSFDAAIAKSMQQGLTPLNFPTCIDPTKPTVAKKMPVTLTINLSNAEEIIHITGKNMWSGDVDSYIGVNFTNIKNPEVEKKLDKLSSVTTLWSDIALMHPGQYVYLTESVSEQNTGILLKWEVYNPDSGEVMSNRGTHYTFVPKTDVPTTGTSYSEVTTGLMINDTAAIWGKKTVNVYNTCIVGCEGNAEAQSSLGITLSNFRWALTAVYGV